MHLRALKTFAGRLGLVRKNTVFEADDKYAKELIKVGAARAEKAPGPDRRAVLERPPRTGGGNSLQPGRRSRGAGKASASSASPRVPASPARTSKPAEGAPE
jgi:hypothetical protein